MKTCIREGPHSGRVTWEHALIFAGRQVNEAFAILPLCEYHHFEDLDKDFGRWVALNRATDEELAKYSKADFKQLKKRLNDIYGRKEE